MRLADCAKCHGFGYRQVYQDARVQRILCDCPAGQRARDRALRPPQKKVRLPIMENKVHGGGKQMWKVKVERLDAADPDPGVGELCIRLPDELIEQLGWEIGDEIEWGETEICEDWGEHQGFTLSNLTKNPKVEPSE